MVKMNHGDLRKFVTADMYRLVDRVVYAKQNRRTPYYILILVKPHYMGPAAISRIENGTAIQNPTQEINLKGVICHARIMVLEPTGIPACPQLGTILLKVDNAKGKIEVCYALPFDTPNLTEDTDNAGDVAVLAAESAQKLHIPLIWN